MEDPHAKTRAFYAQLLTYIDESEAAINKPEVYEVLGPNIINTLTIALFDHRKATEEQRDLELDQEAEKLKWALESEENK